VVNHDRRCNRGGLPFEWSFQMFNPQDFKLQWQGHANRSLGYAMGIAYL